MKIWIAVYIIILLFLWRQYRKIKKNPEKYNDVEAIYQYEPRFRYLKPTELAWRNVADSYWRVNAIAIITLGCICAGLLSLVYYFIKKSFIPEESTCFVFYFTDILLVFSFSGAVFAYAIYCLFGHSKSAFLQMLAFIPAMSGQVKKSRSMMNHLLILTGMIAVALPAFYLSLHDYRYMTDEVIVNNSFFQLHEDTYVMERCKGIILRYRKSGKEESEERYIGTQICIIGEDGKQLKLEWDALGRWSMVESLMAYGVPLIKPDMTEEEFYSVLNWNGEDFLQFYYPELCEQYGISLEE